MKITKDNIVSYVITLQLIDAGYHITYDEVVEQYEIHQKLNPKWRWFREYCQTPEQRDKWIKKCIPIIKKCFKCSKLQAENTLKMIDFQEGLMIKV